MPPNDGESSRMIGWEKGKPLKPLEHTYRIHGKDPMGCHTIRQYHTIEANNAIKLAEEEGIKPTKCIDLGTGNHPQHIRVSLAV
ncbi:MAG: hypothetical protein ABIH92_05510 [Nanoarchaeota archaeon]